MALFIILFSTLFLTSSASAQALTIALDWFLNPYHAPLIIAKDLGFFKKQGIEIEWIPTGSTEEGARLVALQRADAAISSHPRHIFHVAKGLPLVRIAALMDKPYEVFVTCQPFQPGMRIGHAGSGAGFSYLVIRTGLKQHHLKPEDVHLIPQRLGLVTAIMQEQITAAVDVPAAYDLSTLRAHIPHLKVFSYAELGIPTYDQLIIVIHQKHRDDAIWRQFIIGLKNAIAYIRSQPDEVWSFLQTHYPEFSIKYNSAIWQELVQQFAADPGYLDHEKYQTFHDFMIASDVLPAQIPAVVQYALGY